MMRRFGAYLTVLVLVLAGCEGSSESSDTVSGPEKSIGTENSEAVGSDTVTSTVVEREQVTLPDEFASPQDEIIATYLLYNELFLVAAGPPEADPNYGPLFEVLTEPHTTSIREALEVLKRDGHVEVQPEGRGSHRVGFSSGSAPLTGEEVEGQTVTLMDCFINGTEVLDVDGNVVQDGVVTIALAAVMKVVDGSWRVSGTDIKQTYEGENTCDEWV